MDWQSPILCRCISDIIYVLRALQSAKPKLDVLGVVVLMLWHNHYYSYINYLIFIWITWWFYFCLHLFCFALVVQFVIIFSHTPVNFIFSGGAYHLSSWDGFKINVQMLFIEVLVLSMVFSWNILLSMPHGRFKWWIL